MITRDKIRRYRFNQFEIDRFKLLTVKESKFVRQAIDEKFERDYGIRTMFTIDISQREPV